MIWIWAVAFFALSGCCMADDSIYKKMFEEVDWDELLGDPKTVEGYMNCIYGTGSCVPHAQLMKDSIADVFSTLCGQCTDKQKSIFKYSLSKFIPAHPKEWEKILSIYDPTGEITPKLKSFVES